MKMALFFTLGFLLPACYTGNHSPYDKKTEMFAGYLWQQFATRIPAEKHVFFVIPDKGCFPNNKAAIEKFRESLDTCNNLSMVITSNPAYLALLPQKGRIMVDEGDMINRLNLGIGGAGIITTENEKITKIREANHHIADSI